MSTVRIKEVAKLARVSTATVSHVINKTRFVSDSTKRKVLSAIERIGYTPNIHVRNLASGRSRTLGLIISDITNPFFPDLVKSIQERALELGYDVIVLNTNYEPERNARYVQRLLELIPLVAEDTFSNNGRTDVCRELAAFGEFCLGQNGISAILGSHPLPAGESPQRNSRRVQWGLTVVRRMNEFGVGPASL